MPATMPKQRPLNAAVLPGGERGAAVPPQAATAPAARYGAGLFLRVWRSRWFIALRSFAIFVGLWALLAAWVASPLQLPSPATVFDAMVGLARKGELLSQTLISASRLGVALLVAAVIAVPLGFAMALSRELNAYLDPIVELLRPISGIAWIPLGLFIFGVGGTLPVFIMTYVAFFPLLLNTIDGVRDIDRKLLAAAKTMGVTRKAQLVHVVVPAALPSVMVGFRIAFASAWAAIIAAELIGSPSGLGFSIEWYRQLLMSPKVFSFIVLIGVVGYLSDLVLRALQRKLTPWAEGLGIDA
ncbi:ABC transporter permease [Ruegeria marina]|uniref:Sulfonate transport system permease protein n=1 Tax=Ruegeria marina TaxID=639004 RepID=A0A1G6TDV4_9RHOB|nr:ABC transporter permease [Ruegeria marina]SDD27251.1 sulfonate transport system permease protein [Ruegeria marina]